MKVEARAAIGSTQRHALVPCPDSHFDPREAAMTETEMEAKLQKLNEQFLQFKRHQESVRKHWSRIGLISLGFALAFAVVTLVFSALSLLNGTPNPSAPFALTMIPLSFLSIALIGGGYRGATLVSRRSAHL
jgi:hypothetical protein